MTTRQICSSSQRRSPALFARVLWGRHKIAAGPDTDPQADASTSLSLPGHVVATLSGAPVAHATVNAFIATAESGTDGSFTLNTTPAPTSSQAVTVTADGHRPRETVIKWPRTEDLVIDLMSTAKPFDETLYGQLAHGTLGYPGKDYGLFRWASQRRFYLKTQDEFGLSSAVSST